MVYNVSTGAEANLGAVVFTTPDCTGTPYLDTLRMNITVFGGDAAYRATGSRAEDLLFNSAIFPGNPSCDRTFSNRFVEIPAQSLGSSTLPTLVLPFSIR